MLLLYHREILHDEILPPIINSVATFGETLSQVSAWLSGLTSQLSDQFASFLNAVGVERCIRTLGRILNSLSAQFTRFASWARSGFGGLERVLISAFESIKTTLKPILDFLALMIQTAANPLQIPLFIASTLWRLIPEDLKRPIINFSLNVIESFVRGMTSFMPGLAAFGAIIKAAILGFIRRIKDETDEIKLAVSDRMAKLVGGGSIEFMAGWFKGILRGIWDGITDPFKIIFMLVKAVVGVTRFLFNTVQSLLNRPAPERITTEGEELTAAPSVPLPSQATVAALQSAQINTASAESEWEAGQTATFEKEGGVTFDDILAILQSVWDKVFEKSERIGVWLAEKLLEIYQISDFRLGDKLGFFAGIIIFEVILFLLTAGAWAGVTASRPILRAILRLLDIGGEILGGLMRLLGSIRRPLMSALRAIGNFLGNIRPLRAVIDKITDALRVIFRYSDEVAGTTGRTAGEGIEEVTEESAERLARETVEEVSGETAERTGREALEETGEAGGRRTTRETAEKAAQLPQAVAAAKAIAEANDRINSPIPVVIGQLMTLKGTYRWIDTFQAQIEGPGRYSIWMIASKTEIDDRYTTDDDELFMTEEQALEEGLTILERSEAHILVGEERHHPFFKMFLRAFDKAGVRGVRTATGRLRPQRLVDIKTNAHQNLLHQLWDDWLSGFSRTIDPTDELSGLVAGLVRQRTGASDILANQIIRTARSRVASRGIPVEQATREIATEIADQLEDFYKIALQDSEEKLLEVLNSIKNLRGRIGI
ncbi:MAG: hypothetical protein ACE5I1_17770 [bacterium]